jgi:hypothetical protein
MALIASWVWTDAIGDYVSVRRYNRGSPIWASHAETEKVLQLKASSTTPQKFVEPSESNAKEQG